MPAMFAKGGRGGSKGSGKGSKGEKGEKGPCFQFRDKGSCSYGNACRFSHAPPAEMVTQATEAVNTAPAQQVTMQAHHAVPSVVMSAAMYAAYVNVSDKIVNTNRRVTFGHTITYTHEVAHINYGKTKRCWERERYSPERRVEDFNNTPSKARNRAVVLALEIYGDLVDPPHRASCRSSSIRTDCLFHFSRART